tara:strand:- start:308 stop:481 length:174 start_codon:yes stop_codon:yes gene_type:complete
MNKTKLENHIKLKLIGITFLFLSVGTIEHGNDNWFAFLILAIFGLVIGIMGIISEPE